MVSSGRRRSTGTEGRVLALMMSPRSSSREKLWRTTMLLCLSRSREDWLHGEVDAFDSHEQVRSGLRKSQIAAAPV